MAMKLPTDLYAPEEGVASRRRSRRYPPMVLPVKLRPAESASRPWYVRVRIWGFFM